jgi:hypothetical protein
MTSDEIDDTTLEDALRAPGSAAELADEETYRAMFREARTAAVVPVGTSGGVVRPARTAARRVMTGSALVAVFAVGSTGVAAAYSASLPDPVQRAVHSVLAPLGVPAVERQRPVARPPAAPAPATLPGAPAPSAHRSEQPSASPTTHPETAPSASVSPVAVPTPTEISASPSEVLPTESSSPSQSPSQSPSDSPSSSPSESPSDSASPSPTSEPTPTESASPTPKPADVVIVSAGARKKVAPGGTAVVTGRVTTANRSPVPNRRVVLQVHGPAGWRQLVVARTGSDGSVDLATPPLQRTTKVRLRVGALHSAAWRIVTQPTLTASAQTAAGASTVTATAAGAQAGDRVLLLTRRDGALVQEGQGRLDDHGAVTFGLTAPDVDRTYVVQLPATAAHAATQVRVVVPGP